MHSSKVKHENGTFLCAASREQAERAVSYIGDNCQLVETDDSDHVIHTVHSDVYIEAVSSLLKWGEIVLKENLIILRNIHGYSQEEIAEKIGISRQAYAKWENGSTIPDIEKCKRLSDLQKHILKP